VGFSPQNPVYSGTERARWRGVAGVCLGESPCIPRRLLQRRATVMTSGAVLSVTREMRPGPRAWPRADRWGPHVTHSATCALRAVKRRPVGPTCQ
jgi:hypothetical protein